jgi:hypothetical protein
MNRCRNVAYPRSVIWERSEKLGKHLAPVYSKLPLERLHNLVYCFLVVNTVLE